MSRIWTIEFTDVDGKRRRVQGYSDRSATQSKLTQIVKSVERQRAGILNVAYEHTDRSTQDHVNDSLDDLERIGRSTE